VAEAYRFGMQNSSINGAGTEMVGGLLGVMTTWYVDMKQVFVCQNGNSVQTGFPNYSSPRSSRVPRWAAASTKASRH
jgi:hypothetical protein